MKKVFKTDEIPHLWANSQQEEARNSQGNLFFEGNKIYSYGRHFCIAKILPGGVILFTTRKYSNTTAKHIHAVRYACNHKTLVFCNDPDAGITTNLSAFTREMKYFVSVINDPKKREKTKAQAKADLLNVAERVDKYLEAINVPLSETYDSEFMAFYNTAKSQDIESLNKQLAQWEAEKQERQRLAQIEALNKAKKAITKWKKGENVSVPHIVETVYLRKSVDKYAEPETEIVQTSKGAKVSIQAAKVLFELIKAGKDIKGLEIDGYTVIGLNGVLTIGCHKIERKEINRFAKLMGWGEIPHP